MPLRVRQGSTEMILSDADALARLYRQRRLRPSDLVWHAGLLRWVRVDAFLFIDEGGARSAPAGPAAGDTPPGGGPAADTPLRPPSENPFGASRPPDRPR